MTIIVIVGIYPAGSFPQDSFISKQRTERKEKENKQTTNQKMLINRQRRLPGMEKQILLSVYATFPTWHSRYGEDSPQSKANYPVTKCKTLHTQRARYDKASQKIMIEGKPVAVETVAGNEGLSCAGFLEFLEKYDVREFVVVHFTGFRY